MYVFSRLLQRVGTELYLAEVEWCMQEELINKRLQPGAVRSKNFCAQAKKREGSSMEAGPELKRYASINFRSRWRWLIVLIRGTEDHCPRPTSFNITIELGMMETEGSRSSLPIIYCFVYLICQHHLVFNCALKWYAISSRVLFWNVYYWIEQKNGCQIDI